MSGWATKRLGAILLILDGFGGCAGLELKKADQQSGEQTARLEANQRPCELLRAIRDALIRPSSADSRSTWAISVDSAGCCGDNSKVDLRSAIMTFAGPDPDSPRLIDWDSKCDNGPGGPAYVADGSVVFHYVYLFDKGPFDLAFDITPSGVEFEKGKKKNAVTQGCPDVQGMARFLGR